MKSHKEFQRNEILKYSLGSIIICIAMISICFWVKNEYFTFIFGGVLMSILILFVWEIHEILTNPQMYLDYIKKCRSKQERLINIRSEIKRLLDETGSNQQN